MSEAQADGARLPPVTALGMLSLALVLVGGIYLAAHLPEHVPLGPAVALLCASAVVLARQRVRARAGRGLRLGALLRDRQVGAARVRDHRRR